MTSTEVLTRELLDREIMLSCLAEAADRGCDSDLRVGRPARRVLNMRRRASRTLRLSAETTALRTPAPASRDSIPPAPPIRDLTNSLAMARLVLDMRRGELAAHCFEAADLRADARALCAEARQIRRMRAAAG